METFVILHALAAVMIGGCLAWAVTRTTDEKAGRLVPALVTLSATLAIAAALVYVSLGLNVGGYAWNVAGFPVASFAFVPLALLLGVVGLVWPQSRPSRLRWAIVGGPTLGYVLILVAYFYDAMSRID